MSYLSSSESESEFYCSDYRDHPRPNTRHKYKRPSPPSPPILRIIPRKTNTHLQQWLNCKHLIKNLESDTIIKCSTNSIIESFGGWNNVLKCLIEHGNETQLKSIHNIIKKERLKYLKQMELTQTNVSSANMNVPIGERDTASISEGSDIVILNCSINVNEDQFKFFVNMPPEMISYICGYLDRDSIKSFKTCSYLISIRCLEEMNKYSVGICNVNELLHNSYKCNKGFKLNNKCIKYYRYNGNNTFNDLFEQYQIKYNIP
eukprot:434387_1